MTKNTKQMKAGVQPLGIQLIYPATVSILADCEGAEGLKIYPEYDNTTGVF